jgi:hypothetical protein
LVPIAPDSITNVGFYIIRIYNGEWLQYTLDVIEPASYNLRFSLSTKDQADKFSVLANKRLSQPINMPKADNLEIIEMSSIQIGLSSLQIH